MASGGGAMIVYDKLIARLIAAGYGKKDGSGVSFHQLKRDGILSQSSWARLQSGKGDYINLRTIDRICARLGCQPGDLLEWVPDKKL